jgi:hypothetical protein
VLPVLDMAAARLLFAPDSTSGATPRGVVMNPAVKQKGRREAGLFSD